MSDNTEIQDLRNLSAAVVAGQTLGEHPFIIVPDGYKVDDLERLLPRPLAVRANVQLATVEGLIAYVDAFKENATAIFAHPDSGRVVAILDYHEPKEMTGPNPSWCMHRAKYEPAHTVEWQRWIGSDGKWMEQRAFAEFIENNVADIVRPSGAEMLEIASTLEAKTAVEFKSGVRLDNGTQRLTFASETVAKAGDKGTLDIPLTFELALAPFLGGEAYPLSERFRYKIDNGKLTLRYHLVNPHKILEASVKATAAKIATGTGIQPFIGTPPPERA